MNGATQSAPAAWYPDPSGRTPLRYWTGDSWAPWASDGVVVWQDAVPFRRRVDRLDAGALRFVEDVFLPEAWAHGVISDAQRPALAQVVHGLWEESRREPAASSVLAASSVPTVPTGMAQVADPYRPAGTVAFAHPSPGIGRAVPATGPAQVQGQAPTRAPSALSRWWSEARVTIGADLGVHGLAYLGVLLVFVGLFGLVAFAFGEVTPGVRPVAELLGSAVPFVAANRLLHNGATVVARALEVVGGLLLPIMLITSLVDGFPFPPDVHGVTVAPALALVCTAVAGGYAVWTRRHLASGLRYLVGPVAWLAAGMATIGVGRSIPTGQDVAVPSSAQAAAMALALTLTALAARRLPRTRLAGPALVAALPGLTVLGVLSGLTLAAGGWPPVQVAVIGLLLLCTMTLLRQQVSDPVLDVVAPAWWALVSVALLPGMAGPQAAALAAAGFLLILELAGHRRRPPAAMVLPAVGLLWCLLATWADPHWAAGALGVVAVWVVFRRAAPYLGAQSSTYLDVSSAVLPYAVIVALGDAVGLSAGVIAATALVAVVPWAARLRVLRRGSGDGFWLAWWRVAAWVVVLADMTAWALASGSVEHWVATGAVAALAVIVSTGPVRPRLRVWFGVLLSVSAWLMVCSAAHLPVTTRAAALALAGASLVIGVHLSRSQQDTTRAAPPAAAPPAAGPPAGVSGDAGLAGHALALTSLVLGGTGWPLVAALAVATAGFALTAVAGDRGRSPVAGVLARAGGSLRYLPWGAVVVGLPAVAAVAADTGRLLPLTDPWASAVLAVTALVYALVTRAPVSRLCGAVLSWAAFAAGLFATATASRPWPVVAGLASLIVAVVLLPPRRRNALMRWTAWAAVAPLAGLVVHLTVPWYAQLSAGTTVAATLIGAGGILLVGAVGWDLRANPWESHVSPRTGWLVAPAAVGATQVVVGLGAVGAGAVGSPDRGALLLVAAVVLLAVGLFSRAGVMGGAAAVVAWSGVVAMTGPGLEPWVTVTVSAALLAAAEVLHRATSDRAWWTRWDIPVLLAAAPVAGSALIDATGTDAFALTFALVGLQFAVVAVRLRHLHTVAELLGWAATLLVLTGASAAGAGWLSLALLALAATHTTIAVREVGAVRIVRQLVGVAAAVASWFAGLEWLAWSAQLSVDRTAAGAGAVVLAAGGAAWMRRLDRSWVLVWGGAAAGVVTVIAAAASLRLDGFSGGVISPSAWVVLGVVEVSAGAFAAAPAVRLAVLRDVGAIALLASLLLGFEAAATSPSARVSILTVAGAALAAVTVALATRPAFEDWRRPCAEVGGLGVFAALLIGLAQPSDTLILVPVLVAASVQLAAAGVVWRSVGLQMLSPTTACGAWLLFVSHATSDGAGLYTVAIGLALLVIVSLWRRDLREHGANLASGEVIGLEMAGIAFLVGDSFVEAVTRSVTHLVVAIGLGIAVASWGGATRVRRRVATGAVIVLAAAVVLVVVPLVSLLPAWSGAGLWLLVAGVGLAALLVAALLERARTAARSARLRIAEVVASWE